jgi:hypothetical protein
MNERTIQMTDDEIKELSGMKANEDCCLFCESRCPDCGSINIVVKYRRYYQIDYMQMQFEHSDAQVYCYDCIPEINDEKFFIMEGVFDDQWQDYDDILEGIWSPELAKQLDTLFDDFEQHGLPSDLQEEIDEQIGEYKYFVMTYSFYNRKRNEISLSCEESVCLDSSNNEEHNDDIASELSYLVSIDSVEICIEEDAENPAMHKAIKRTYQPYRMVPI